MAIWKNTIAIVYDFDGTLTPHPIQEYTVLPKIGVEGQDFWDAVKVENDRDKGDMITTYMRLMLEYSNERKFPITRKVLGGLARNIKYFSGIPKFFNRINEHVKKRHSHIKIRHYIISSGLKEILKKTKIDEYFHNTFASEYHYNHYGAADFTKIAINDTLKTQFLFRINKGKEDMTESINMYMPIQERPIPFDNILYIGDGLTDVPCMSVTKKSGGYAIAVYQPEKEDTLTVCKELLEADRVDFIAEADYTRNSELDRVVKLTLDTILKGIIFRNETHRQYIKYLEEENSK